MNSAKAAVEKSCGDRQIRYLAQAGLDMANSDELKKIDRQIDEEIDGPLGNVVKALAIINRTGIATFKDGTGRGLLISGFTLMGISVALKIWSGLSFLLFQFSTVDFAIMIGIATLLITFGGSVKLFEFHTAAKARAKVIDAALVQQSAALDLQKDSQQALKSAQNNPLPPA